MTTATTSWERPRPAGLQHATSASSFLNPRIRKELRLVMPFFLTSLACITMIAGAGYGLQHAPSHSMQQRLFQTLLAAGSMILPMAYCALAVQSFSAEYSHSTMSELLALPLSRSVLFHEKFIPTAVALLLSAFYGIAVVLAGEKNWADPMAALSPLIATILLLACAGPGIALRMKLSLPSLLTVLAILVLVLSAAIYLLANSMRLIGPGVATWIVYSVILTTAVLIWISLRRLPWIYALVTSAALLIICIRVTSFIGVRSDMGSVNLREPLCCIGSATLILDLAALAYVNSCRAFQNLEVHP